MSNAYAQVAPFKSVSFKGWPDIDMRLRTARDLMNEGVRINTILPDVFETTMMLNVRKQLLDALAVAVPFPKRLGPLREVLDVEAANLVRSLGSEEFRTAVAWFAA
jgi:NAD(P)-dependent dehydrogenase (short-subunit alcohol dehydrogenase family)